MINQLTKKFSILTSTTIAIIASLSSLPFSKALAVDLEFPDFSDISELTLNGFATTTTTSDGEVLRLTPAIGGLFGSAFTSTTINTSEFSTFFRFRISDKGSDGPIPECNPPGAIGADGLVFIVQSASSTIVGRGGGFLGYEGINNSVGIEFDTWCNFFTNDPDTNHVGIDINGSVNHGPGAPFTVGVEPEFDDGNIWYAWVDYDGSNLEIRTNQTGNRPTSPLLSRVLDLTSILGQSDGFVGFSSGTGQDFGNHDILSWEYRDRFEPIDQTPTKTPEPGLALSLLVLTTVSVAIRRQ